MNHFYTMSGGLNILGCSHSSGIVRKRFKYAPGDELFLTYRARKGVLEKVKIKKIIAVANGRSERFIVPFYKDINNATYNESDLGSQSEAVALATAYYQNQLILVDKLVSSCSIS